MINRREGEEANPSTDLSPSPIGHPRHQPQSPTTEPHGPDAAITSLTTFIQHDIRPPPEGHRILLPHLTTTDRLRLSECSKDFINYRYNLSKVKIKYDLSEAGVWDGLEKLLLGQRRGGGLEHLDLSGHPSVLRLLDLASEGCFKRLKVLSLAICQVSSAADHDDDVEDGELRLVPSSTDERIRMEVNVNMTGYESSSSESSSCSSPKEMSDVETDTDNAYFDDNTSEIKQEDLPPRRCYYSVVEMFQDKNRAAKMKADLDLVQYLNYDGVDIINQMVSLLCDENFHQMVWEQTFPTVLDTLSNIIRDRSVPSESLPRRSCDFTKRLPTKMKKQIVAAMLLVKPKPFKEWQDKHDKWRKEKTTRHDKWGHTLCNCVINENSRYTGDPSKFKTHLGGNRCERTGCQNSAQRSSQGTGLPGMCFEDGGGDRCEYEDECYQVCCSNSAIGKKGGASDMCISHGGAKNKGKLCLKCGQKFARGSTRKTGEYGGGGNRCEKDCCTPLPVRTWAAFIHPYDQTGICTMFARNMVNKAFLDNNLDEYKKLKEYFVFKRDLVCRAEQAFYFAINKAAPDLRQLEYALDHEVLSQFYGKAKNVTLRRPDAFYLYRDPKNGNCSGLHFEYDEKTDHEDDDDRLTVIAHQAGCGPERVYVVRVNGRQNTKDTLCERHIINKTHVYYELTERGHKVVAEVAKYMQDCVELMKRGVVPTSRNRKMYF